MARSARSRPRRRPSPARRGAALLALGALAGCGAPRAATPAPVAPTSASTMGPAAAIARARADSAQYPYTTADIAFMTHMIGHHAQAITMARLAPTHGASPAVQRLAARIINAQGDEIALMQTWLRDRGQPVPDAMPAGMKMDMGGMEHEMPMPGMLTDAQMQRLAAAQGTEFDRLFLTFMIQHHRGAVSMVKTLFDAQGAGQDITIFKFASDVSVDQTTEIDRMLQMLLELGG